MNDEVHLKKLETFFLALADKTRLRILNLMRENEVCVYFFTEVLRESQPKISRHLAYLRNAKIVSARRDGKWIHYRIDVPEDFYIAQILHDTLEALKSDDDMQADYEKLISICGEGKFSETIAHAPKSDMFAEPHTFIEKEELAIYLL